MLHGERSGGRVQSILSFHQLRESTMNSNGKDIRDQQQQRDDQQAQQEATKNQQQAKEREVEGRHKQDGQKDHKGADKGPRGQ